MKVEGKIPEENLEINKRSVIFGVTGGIIGGIVGMALSYLFSRYHILWTVKCLDVTDPEAAGFISFFMLGFPIYLNSIVSGGLSGTMLGFLYNFDDLCYKKIAIIFLIPYISGIAVITIVFLALVHIIFSNFYVIAYSFYFYLIIIPIITTSGFFWSISSLHDSVLVKWRNLPIFLFCYIITGVVVYLITCLFLYDHSFPNFGTLENFLIGITAVIINTLITLAFTIHTKYAIVKRISCSEVED